MSNHRASIHNHSYYSNLRLLDALSSPTAIVDKAIELGIDMIGISEHESLSSHIILNKYAQELKSDYPNFKVALGNEIYLTETRDSKQRYYHFLLCAKDARGHEMLRKMSSIAWLNSYFDRGLQRVPLLYDELAGVIKEYGKGHLIASSACIGSLIGQQLLAMKQAEKVGDDLARKAAHDLIVKHVLFCKEQFEDDFYFEIAPATYKDQIFVNQRTLQLCNVFGIKATVQDDSHRLTQEDFIAHKALLNSKQGEREDIDSFYGFTYLQSYDDIREHLEPVGCDVDQLFANSMEMYDKVEEYSLLHNQQVPQVVVPDFPKQKKESKYNFLNKLYNSDNPQERYWVNYCVDKLKEKGLDNDQYLSELDSEADVQLTIGEALGTCIFSYPIFLQHYFDLIWECGGCIGTGRGSSSAGLDNYLMNLTQYDPIKAGVNNYFRYLNKSRYELPDLDFDLPPTIRPKWFEKIREERGELGLVQICTFSTMSSKAAILAACRGYRTEDFPNGIDVDQAQYLTSLVGQQRGFTYTITDMIEGNPEKDLKPNKTFLNAVNQYPGLLNIIRKLEGTISSRSIHASGIVFNEPGQEYSRGAVMTAPDGTIITQWSLHDSESAGYVKIDSLVTDVMEKITQCLLMLQEKNEIDKDLSLKNLYNKYLHPDVLPLEDPKIWDAIDKLEVLNLFQFDTQVGGQAVKKLKPRSVQELAAINALIRLMAQEKGAETPVDRYYRIQNNPDEWYDEMTSAGLTQEEQDIIKEYCSYSYGTLPLQDDLMLMMMDERLFGFDLKTTNDARKTIGKKLMNKIPELHKIVLEKAKSPALGHYIWDVLFNEQMGYAFNKEHTYSYSLIAVQCAYLATYFNPIYWNTACLRVDAGLEEDSSTNYSKVAKAIGNMVSKGIKVSLIDINQSQYMFEPDSKKNQIIFGMKGLTGINGEIIEEIINNRPYESLEDFLNKVKVNKTQAVALIKSGAFDEFDDREQIMRDYIWMVCEPKKRLTMQNFNGLNQKGLLPDELDLQKRTFVFNKALKEVQKGENFIIKDNYYRFYEKFFNIDLLQVDDDGDLVIAKTVWKKQYDKTMDVAKQYIKEHAEELLRQLNNSLFNEMWDKYASGSLAKWEMDSLSFYASPHELINVNQSLYNIVSFNSLSEDPEVDYMFKRGAASIPIYKTHRIMGTIIAKDDMKSCVSLLTTDSGVVTVKMSKDFYASRKKKISQIGEDGDKHYIEDSFFKKGTLCVCNGYRRGDMFFLKSYKRSNSHQFYKINKVHNNGTIEMEYARADELEDYNG